MTIIIKKTMRYTYKCVSCQNNYIEQRAENENQFFTQCASCNGNLEEIEVFMAIDEIEVPDSETIAKPVK